jgi:hypothetical protein
MEMLLDGAAQLSFRVLIEVLTQLVEYLITIEWIHLSPLRSGPGG